MKGESFRVYIATLDGAGLIHSIFIPLYLPILSETIFNDLTSPYGSDWIMNRFIIIHVSWNNFFINTAQHDAGYKRDHMSFLWPLPGEEQWSTFFQIFLIQNVIDFV